MKAILEQIPVGRENSIVAFRFAEQDFGTPWHFHPQHELTYIEASHGTKFIGDYVGAYEPGELVLLRANLPHCWKNHAHQTSFSTSTVIQWEKGIFAKVPELSALFGMLTAASRGLIFAQSAIAPILPQLLQLPDLRAHSLYVQLLSVLVRLSDCPYRSLSESHFRDDLPTEHSSRMAKIHAFVETQYQRKIYLKEVADLVSMSEQSFSRFFSKMMGRPFFSFLNEYRVHVAGRMLIDTDWSVAQIGYACGYESLPFFHKQFNKFMKLSPARYRKQHRG